MSTSNEDMSSTSASESASGAYSNDSDEADGVVFMLSLSMVTFSTFTVDGSPLPSMVSE